MVKFPEANARKLKNVFVCRRCKRKIRSPSRKVLSGLVKCRNCGSRVLRTIRKK